MSRVVTILQEIVQNRRRKLENVFGKAVLPRVQGESSGLVENEFTAALRDNQGCAVIAEVKMGSPRIGSLEARLFGVGARPEIASPKRRRTRHRGE